MPPATIGNSRSGVPFGHGIARSTSASYGTCVCYRPRCRVLCRVCGYLGWGRVKIGCPSHPQTIFLIDMTQCPDCKAYANWMMEF